MGGEDMEAVNRKGTGGRGEGDETSGLLPPYIPSFWKTLRRGWGRMAWFIEVTYLIPSCPVFFCWLLFVPF